VLGTSAYSNPKTIESIANKFGNQAVVVTVDLLNRTSNFFTTNSGEIEVKEDFLEYITKLERLGAGEIYLQCKEMDGLMMGMCFEQLKKVISATNCPVIISSGASQQSDFEQAFDLGASGVAVGALFQFTEITPATIRESLRLRGVPVRNV